MQLWTGGRGTGEILAITDPARVSRDHRALLEVGADAISTETFGATATTMLENQISVPAAAANRENARLGRNACDAFSTPARRRLLLGSIGPTLNLLSLSSPTADFARIEADYREQAEALVSGGVDILHFECCMDMENLRAGMAAVRSLAVTTPVCISAEIELMGTMLDGTTPDRFVAAARDYGAAYVGISGHLQAAMTALHSLKARGDFPDAIFVDTFQPGCEAGC
jgi:5-methyltetrahydrofolate--homocysteine methyltransferase